MCTTSYGCCRTRGSLSGKHLRSSTIVVFILYYTIIQIVKNPERAISNVLCRTWRVTHDIRSGKQNDTRRFDTAYDKTHNIHIRHTTMKYDTWYYLGNAVVNDIYIFSRIELNRWKITKYKSLVIKCQCNCRMSWRFFMCHKSIVLCRFVSCASYMCIIFHAKMSWDVWCVASCVMRRYQNDTSMWP